MKVAVLSFSGNVGKSTIARFLLAPRIPGARQFSVESINAEGHGEQIRADQFVNMIEEVMLSDKAVIDVGASNIEQFVIQMQEQGGDSEDIHYYVIPTVPDLKQQKDTLNTIKTLSSLGVEADKMRIVFNMVNPTHMLSDDFGYIFSEIADKGLAVVNKDARMNDVGFYQLMQESGMTLDDLANLDFNPRERLKDETDPEQRAALVRLVTLTQRYQKNKSDLDDVFKAIFK